MNPDPVYVNLPGRPNPVTEHYYETRVTEERRMGDPKPTVHVELVETVTTTTSHPDGSTTRHETPPTVVASWTHSPEEQL